MTPWQWWARSYGDVEYEGSYQLGGYLTKVEAIAAGQQEWPGEIFYVIEARQSTAEKYYDESCETIPFKKMRNQELLDPEPHALLGLAIKIVADRAQFWVQKEQDFKPKKWWQFWIADTRGIYDGMASELDIIAGELWELL